MPLLTSDNILDHIDGHSDATEEGEEFISAQYDIQAPLSNIDSERDIVRNNAPTYIAGNHFNYHLSTRGMLKGMFYFKCSAADGIKLTYFSSKATL